MMRTIEALGGKVGVNIRNIRMNANHVYQVMTDIQFVPVGIDCKDLDGIELVIYQVYS